MDFSIDLLYLCLFFSVWTCVLILCCSTFLSFNTKKIINIFSILSTCFPILFAITANLNNLSYEYSFPFLSVNDISFSFGAFINKTNTFLIGIYFVCSLIATIANYKTYENEKDYNKYSFLLMLINIFALCFFISPNLLQLFIFFVLFAPIFYILENEKNTNHERAKNFLVINKIGDFILFATVCTLYTFGLFFDFPQSSELLDIKYINVLFDGIQSVCDTEILLLLIILFVLAILIKTILIFIHPLKSRIDIFVLSVLSITSCLYWFAIFLPIFSTFDYFNKIMLVITAIFILTTSTTIYLKAYKHDEILNLNNSGTIFFKNIYLRIAKIFEIIEKYIFDKLYENISKITMKISGCLQFPSTKTTLYAFIFNIIGISFLILLAWIIYNITMKG